jgi:hypothetical protein
MHDACEAFGATDDLRADPANRQRRTHIDQECHHRAVDDRGTGKVELDALTSREAARVALQQAPDRRGVRRA